MNEERTVERFKKRTIWIHWIHTAAFVVLVVTGATLFFPGTGSPAGGGLVRLLHRIAVIQTIPDAPNDDVADPQTLLSLTERLSPEDVQLFYEIGIQGQRSLAYAPDPRTGLEMILLRMLAFRPDEPAKAARPAAPVAAGAGRRGERGDDVPDSSTASEENAPQPAGESPAAAEDRGDWTALVARMRLGGVASQLAAHSVMGGWDGDRLTLHLDPANQSLCTAKAVERVQSAVSEVLGQSVSLKVDVLEIEEETRLP